MCSEAVARRLAGAHLNPYFRQQTFVLHSSFVTFVMGWKDIDNADLNTRKRVNHVFFFFIFLVVHLVWFGACDNRACWKRALDQNRPMFVPVSMIVRLEVPPACEVLFRRVAVRCPSKSNHSIFPVPTVFATEQDNLTTLIGRHNVAQYRSKKLVTDAIANAKAS